MYPARTAAAGHTEWLVTRSGPSVPLGISETHPEAESISPEIVEENNYGFSTDCRMPDFTHRIQICRTCSTPLKMT